MIDDFCMRVLSTEDWRTARLENLELDDGLRLQPGKETGMYCSEAVDSGIDDCRWHRIVIDAAIPGMSSIRISFSTSKTGDDWGQWSKPVVFRENHRDALVPTHGKDLKPGKYVKLKVEFFGNGTSSPALRIIKLYYPRFSYLRYLPAVYQKDSRSREFLERFLSIFETQMYDVEGIIIHISRYFDAVATTEEFVPWLAKWLSLKLYESLGEKKREFITRAWEFYTRKGTLRGLSELASFLTGKKCCVKEYANNVFRSYGMEHDVWDETETTDEMMCRRFFRRTSKTVNTADEFIGEIRNNIGKYEDELHYVYGTDKEKKRKYARNVIVLFIFAGPRDEVSLIKPHELYEVVRSFVPVFVELIIETVIEDHEIYDVKLIKDGYRDHLQISTDEKYDALTVIRKDTVKGYEVFSTFDVGVESTTNNPGHRIFHSGIDVWLES